MSVIDWYRIIILGLLVESPLFLSIFLSFLFNFLGYTFPVILGAGNIKQEKPG